MLREHGRSGYFEPMARAGRTEPDSVSIWLKLSAEDAARMTQVLARPEFAGWTRAEWCLEMIQTALGYYTRPRWLSPAGRGPRSAARGQEPEPAPPAPEPEPAAPEPELAAPEPEPMRPSPSPLRRSPNRSAGARIRPPPNRVRAATEAPTGSTEARTGSTEAGCEPTRSRNPKRQRRSRNPSHRRRRLRPRSRRPRPECPHPADARDYQTGTCAVCGAILWD